MQHFLVSSGIHESLLVELFRVLSCTPLLDILASQIRGRGKTPRVPFFFGGFLFCFMSDFAFECRTSGGDFHQMKAWQKRLNKRVFCLFSLDVFMTSEGEEGRKDSCVKQIVSNDSKKKKKKSALFCSPFTFQICAIKSGLGCRLL